SFSKNVNTVTLDAMCIGSNTNYIDFTNVKKLILKSGSLQGARTTMYIPDYTEIVLDEGAQGVYQNANVTFITDQKLPSYPTTDENGNTVYVSPDSSKSGMHADDTFTSWSDLLEKKLITVENGIITGADKTNLKGQLILNSQVTEIADNAFKDCTGLTSIVMPQSVTNVGKYAFSGCTGLTSVNLSENINKIDDRTFAGCTSLNSIHLGPDIVSIGDSAFDGCASLKELDPDDALTSIGAYAFRGTGITDVKFSSGLTEIGNGAFESCTSLKKISLGKVRKLSEDLFKGCTNLATVTVPDSVSEIGANVFNGCTSLTDIDMPDGEISIEADAFTGSSITELYIKKHFSEYLLNNYDDYNKSAFTKDITLLTFNKELIEKAKTGGNTFGA
ncbi:MAG: leucine-rich repeat domain-containing protein, partial [Lachnospiraceae bacterium]|nr:leucine-rich repeat domain-containing protein [Lachnospiraceae bacterium]